MATASRILPHNKDEPDLDPHNDEDGIPCILVAQDDVDPRRDVAEWLSSAGYDVRICDRSQELIDIVHIVMPSVLVLDYGRPPVDTLEMCRRLRQNPLSPLARRLPIIVLRADPDETDQTVCLEVGADAYVGKPVHRRLLVAQVRALLRRVAFTLAGDDPDQSYVTSGDLAVDLLSRRATREGNDLTLTRLEFDLLALFMTNAGQVLSSDQIISRVWREKPKEIRASLRVHLHRLREKIEPNPAEPHRLETVAGRGYVFRG